MILNLILFLILSIPLSEERLEGNSSESTGTKAFQVGEKLTFIIGYEFIPAGKSVLSVDNIATINGKKAYHISSRTKSHRFFDPFFKVRDEIDSYMDISSFQSLRFRK